MFFFLMYICLFVYIFVYMFVLQQQQQKTTIVFSGLGGGRIWEELQTGKTQSKYIV